MTLNVEISFTPVSHVICFWIFIYFCFKKKKKNSMVYESPLHVVTEPVCRYSFQTFILKWVHLYLKPRGTAVCERFNLNQKSHQFMVQNAVDHLLCWKPSQTFSLYENVIFHWNGNQYCNKESENGARWHFGKTCDLKWVCWNDTTSRKIFKLHVKSARLQREATPR